MTNIPSTPSGPSGRPDHVTLAFRYRAEPTGEQEAYLRRCAAGFHAVWNATIAARTSTTAPVEACGVRPGRRGEPCTLPHGHQGAHDLRARCTGRAEIPSVGPCRYHVGHAGPCRPVVTARVRRFSPHRPPSRWLTEQRETLRWWAVDAAGVRRGCPYESVPNIVLRAGEKKVDWAYRSYQALRRNGDYRARPPSFRSVRRVRPTWETQLRPVAPASWLRSTGGRWALVRAEQPQATAWRISDPWIRVRYHRPIPPGVELREAHWAYSRTDHHWYVSLICRVPVPDTCEPLPDTPTITGVDRGVKVLAACYGVDTATGEVVVDHAITQPKRPVAVRRPEMKRHTGPTKRLLLLERSLARRHRQGSPRCWDDAGRHIPWRCHWKRSNRARRNEAELARLRARQARQRRETIEVASHDLVDGSTTRNRQPAHVVVFEDLDVKSMTRSAKGTPEQPGRNVRAKAGLNRGIQAAAWGTLRARTVQKAESARLDGRTVIVIDVPAANTSRRCPVCNYTDRANRRTQATFRCVACGHTDNADRNAARNLVTHAATSGALASGEDARPTRKGSQRGRRKPPGDRGRRGASGQRTGPAPEATSRTDHQPGGRRQGSQRPANIAPAPARGKPSRHLLGSSDDATTSGELQPLLLSSVAADAGVERRRDDPILESVGAEHDALAVGQAPPALDSLASTRPCVPPTEPVI
jgi:putative transposase